jgi:hypothetical protein
MAVFKKKEKKDLSQGAKSRKIIINLVFRLIILFMALVAVIYGAVSFISGSSIFVPKDASGVLSKVKQKNSYAWNVQIVRKIRFPGSNPSDPAIEQHRLTGAAINVSENSFQAGVRGVFPISIFYNSDGNYTLQLPSNSDKFEIITDVCGGKPSIPAETLKMPSKDMISNSEPILVEDEETFFGERAWMLRVKKPAPELVSRLFWLDFLDRVSEINPSLKDWVLSKKERKLIAAGDYEVERSKILISYKNPSQIVQIDLNINIANSKYRIVAQIVPTTKGELLENKDFGDPDCP